MLVSYKPVRAPPLGICRGDQVVKGLPPKHAEVEYICTNAYKEIFYGSSCLVIHLKACSGSPILQRSSVQRAPEFPASEHHSSSDTLLYRVCKATANNVRKNNLSSVGFTDWLSNRFWPSHAESLAVAQVLQSGRTFAQ
jgi:hypothetical protein